MVTVVMFSGKVCGMEGMSLHGFLNIIFKVKSASLSGKETFVFTC